ncbi:MAG: ABC transporter permease [Propionibacteriaceae bacterium]|jgi:ABC-2 type transport system permease protein|nr:ABC transporter permease [Propionibacteriaceae bacterium]
MLNRILAITGKEFLHLWRDPRMLAAVLLMPVLMLLLFAYAISFDIRNVPTGIVDMDNTPTSREYAQAFDASDLFNVSYRADTISGVDAVIDEGRVSIVLVIPKGFGKDLLAGLTAEVGVYVDGSEPNSGRVSRAAALALTTQYNRELAVRWADLNGVDISAVGGLEPLMRTWYNPELKSSDYLIPGLLVVIMMIVTVQQTSVSLVRERAQGTQDQITVSATRPTELLLGKLLPWSILALTEVGIITLVSKWLFNIPLRGNLFAFALGTFIFVVCGLALGMLISSFCNTLESANMMAIVVAFLPSFLLSGFVFALEQLPEWIQWLSCALPVRFMVELTRDVFLKGAGFAEVLPEMSFMLIFAVLAITLAAHFYRRRLR